MIVTVPELKAHLRIQHDEEDALLESLLSQAQACAAKFHRKRDVFQGAQGGNEVEELEYNADIFAAKDRSLSLCQVSDGSSRNGDRTLLGKIDSTDEIEQRAFSAAADSQQDYEASGLNVEIDPIQNQVVDSACMIGFAQTTYADNWLVDM